MKLGSVTTKLSNTKQLILRQHHIHTSHSGLVHSAYTDITVVSLCEPMKAHDHRYMILLLDQVAHPT